MQTLDLFKVCSNDKNTKIKFECINYDSNEVIHSVKTTLQKIINGKTVFFPGNGCVLTIKDFDIFAKPTLA